jgi:hypothetical protein
MNTKQRVGKKSTGVGERRIGKIWSGFGDKY